MSNDTFKAIYALVLLLIIFLWAGLSVWITYRALLDKLTTDILAAAGANVLLGALIGWNGNVVQHYFRKSKVE